MSKCDAGIELSRFEKCPRCGSGPEGPCWAGIREDQDRIANLRALIAELLDDPLILEGAPPGIGWFDRAEEAVGRPVGSSFAKATLRKREEQTLTMSMFLRKEDLENARGEVSSPLSSPEHSPQEKSND